MNEQKLGYTLKDPCQKCPTVLPCIACAHFKKVSKYCHCGREMSISMTSKHKGFWMCICGNQEFENFNNKIRR